MKNQYIFTRNKRLEMELVPGERVIRKNEESNTAGLTDQIDGSTNCGYGEVWEKNRLTEEGSVLRISF